MTPERAAELADTVLSSTTMDGVTVMDVVTVRQQIKRSILAACNEQKEADAKICEELLNIKIDGAMASPPIQSIYAKAIRSGE